MTPAELRALALGLPEAEEVETWGHPTFRVRGKMFASCDAEGEHATFKAPLSEQAELIASEPDTYSVPAYVGKHGWVRVRLSAVPADALREHLVDAWRRTAPKRLVAASGL